MDFANILIIYLYIKYFLFTLASIRVLYYNDIG